MGDIRRFELHDDKSSKFWSIERDGTRVRVNWGRVGSTAQAKEKSFDDEAGAVKEALKLVREKERKGYVEVDAPAADLRSTSADTAQAPEQPAPTTLPSNGDPASEPVAHPEIDEAQFYYPPQVVRQLLPCRDGVAAPAALKLDAAKSRAAVIAMLSSIEFETRDQRLTAAIHERIEAAGRTPPDVAPADLETEAAIVALAGSHAAQSRSQNSSIDYLVAASGPARALEILVRASTYTVDFTWQARAPKYKLKTSKNEPWRYMELPTRLRHHLALCNEPAYQEALATAERLFSPDSGACCLIAFLFPERSDWASRALAYTREARVQASMLLAVLTDPDALQTTLESDPYGAMDGEWAAEIAVRAGASALPLLASLLERSFSTEGQGRIAWAISCIPSDDAVDALVRNVDKRSVLPALNDVVDRWPQRALRCLANAATKTRGGPTRDLLAALIRSRGAVLEGAIRSLPDDQQRLIGGLLDDPLERPREPATQAELPSLLASPPWRAGKSRQSAKPLALEPLPYTASVRYERGEREPFILPTNHGRYWHRSSPSSAIAFADEPAASRALATWDPNTREHRPDFDYALYENIPWILARFGDAAIPKLEAFAQRGAARLITHLLPIDSPRIALAAARLIDSKSARNHARAYLERHPEASAIALIPAALGKGKDREPAARSLTHLAQGESKQRVLEVADRYGEAARAMVDALLARDPFDDYPAKIPELPSFFRPDALPVPILTNGKALTTAAVTEFATMLSFSRTEQPYPGIEQVVRACEPTSLGRFSWGLFTAWLNAGADAKADWAMRQLGWIGDDECVRQLTPLMRKWPGEGAHPRAVKGLDVLAELGTDLALMALNGIAQKVKFKGLRERAQDKIEEVAAARGLSRAELEDRIVPDLGLDASGSMVLDFGPRQFRVGFDEALKPFVLDASGKRLKELPKPGKKDDAEQAAVAAAAWKGLKADVRQLAAIQIARLERAMCDERRWTPDLFMQLLVGHPLMVHLVRRLIWGQFVDDRLLGTFRVAEDGTLADIDEEEAPVPDTGEIGIVHVLALDDESKAAWGGVLADYEIAQPFVQLGREVYRPSSEEAATKKLLRYQHREIPTGDLMKLERMGWQRGEPQDAGISRWYDKPVASDKVVRLGFSPGLAAGDPMWEEKQVIEDLVIVDKDGWTHEGEMPFGELSPIGFSELIRDMEQIAG